MKSQYLKEKNSPNICSRLFFCWLCPVFFAGSRRDLEEEDLIAAKKTYFSKSNGDKLEGIWMNEITTARAAGRKPSLTRALWRAYYGSFLFLAIPILMLMILRTYQPILFGQLLNYWSEGSETPRETAAGYAMGIVAIAAATAYLTHHSMLGSQQLGMRVRVATSSLMFRKMMRMSLKSIGETATGKIINLMSNDVCRFDTAFMFVHYLWILPFQMVYVGYLMYSSAGIASLVGIAAMVLIIAPIQALLARILGKMRQLSACGTDNRIKVMDEIINGIQVIKMYAWETPFATAVSSLRDKEMDAINRANIIRITSSGFMIVTERVTLFITLITYCLLGNQPTAAMVFPLQQFFQIIQVGVSIFLPQGAAFMSEAFISVRRIEEFLLLEERSDLATMDLHSSALFFGKSKDSEKNAVKAIKYNEAKLGYTGFDNKGYENNESNKLEYQVEIKNATASWNGEQDHLKDISLRIKRGKLYALIGPVGSGKSSFLSLLLRELPLQRGSSTVHGSISYASQEAWLFPKTVRENILFGLPYDAERYKQTVKYCCLEKDFKQLLYGDQTLVGERGVSLSGGQRARINLARAVYKQADTYLLDDPLSAVDANVGRKLFDGCISGYLQHKTRILVTHQVHYLKTADIIVVFNEGRIVNVGTYTELVNSASDFTNLLMSLEESKDKDENAQKEAVLLAKRDSILSIGSEAEAQLLEPEERAKGRLSWSVFLGYWGASGICLALVSFSLIIFAQVMTTLCDYFISYWTNNVAAWQQTQPDPSLTEIVFDPSEQMGPFTSLQYLIIYVCLVGGLLLFVNIRTFAFVSMCKVSSKSLHDRMFSRMLTTYMRFFDTSSSGRILNRFSKDMGAADELLPRSMLDTLQIFLTLASILTLNAIALPWTLLMSAVLLVIFILLLRMYMSTSQAVKRLEGTTKSPVFGIITSSLNGIATIRSLKAQDRLINEFDESQDIHTFAWNTFIAGGVGFGFFLDCMCTVYIIIVMSTFLYLDLGDAIPIGNVGLAVSQSLILMLMLQFGARNCVDMIGQMTSVERIMEYTKLKKEENLETGVVATPDDWPNAGRVVFEGVFLRYAPDAPPVLKDLNFVIEAGTKIGIVGRTGAGKSSLISALFRFATIDGSITIDGIDTYNFAKQELRTRISIIPQEPVLFSATIRYNLDPFNKSSDEQLWRALEQVDLKDAIPTLDYKVSEGGSNFSVGQRQLVCLARAILRDNKILVMDEATANVDPQTDAFIQETIRRQFKKCTVLTIAHRLNTVADADGIIVMDSGKVVEYDQPYILLTRENSKLSSMAREAGPSVHRQLIEVAKVKYESSTKDE